MDTLILQNKDKTERFVLNEQSISKVEYRDDDDTVIVHSLGEVIIARAIPKPKSKSEWIYTLEVYPSAASQVPRLKMEMSEQDDVRLMEYLKKHGLGPAGRKN